MPGAFPMSAKLKQEFDLQSPLDHEIGFAAMNTGKPALTTLLGHTKGERARLLECHLTFEIFLLRQRAVPQPQVHCCQRALRRRNSGRSQGVE